VARLPLEGEGWEFAVADAEAALDLVAALQALDPAPSTEWTGLARPRLSRSATGADLRVRVTQRRDWLGLGGEVEVDGVRAPMSGVLQAIRDGRRFVQAEDGTWIRLERALREQLAPVAEASGERDEVAPLHAPLVAGLAEAGVEVEAPPAWDALVARFRAARDLEAPVPEGFAATLRDYQLAGFRWLARLAEWAPGACLADDMGLGKTVQALALLARRASLGPALVVAPTSVAFNWQREAERFAPALRVRPYRGAERSAAGLAPGDVLVTSYAVLARDAEALAAVEFATVVLDEAQAVKNAETLRARAARDLQAGFRLALTGTPVENRLAELWSLFRIIAPGLLGSAERFRDRFVAPIERDRDEGRRRALARIVRPFLLRRTKAEVAPELPPRTEVTRLIDLSRGERRLYDETRLAAVEQLGRDGGPPQERRFRILAAITRLRQIACHPRLVDGAWPGASSKLAELVELVAELRDEGHRALVFSQFTSFLALARTALHETGLTTRYLDGATPAPERAREVDAFQRGEGDVFLLSLKAGGTGLNLTAASYVVLLDPWWNPAVEDQAADRAHRIGQTRPVTIYRLVARGTIEEAILKLHGEKRALVETVLDGTGQAAPLASDEQLALVREAATDAEPADEPEAPAAPALDLDAAILRFDEWLLREHAAGRISQASTVRGYVRFLKRFRDFLNASGAVASGPDDLAPLFARYLAEAKAPASDAILGKTAVSRFAAFLRG
jgi:superfamily II DNA or RNA helicase